MSKVPGKVLAGYQLASGWTIEEPRLSWSGPIAQLCRILVVVGLCWCAAPSLAQASCPQSAQATPETMTKSMRACLNGETIKAFRDVLTPLHQAVESSNDPAIIEALLDAGADPNARTLHGSTALHSAAGVNENPAVVEFLLAAGAELHARDNSGSTALHHAAGLNGTSRPSNPG